MVKRKIKKIRKIVTRTFTWWVRPHVYYCIDMTTSYRPSVYTKEIYKEIADDENPFIDTLEEWRIYAEQKKREEINAAALRRWKVSECGIGEKPSLGFKIEERESSKAEESVVVPPEVPPGIIEAIKGYEKSADALKDSASRIPIPELKADFERRAVELEGKANELRKKYGLEEKEL